MLDQHAHLRIHSLTSELRDIELRRPRVDRPEYRRTGRLRSIAESLVHRPARVALEPGERVPGVTIRPAGTTDRSELARLAELNERHIPEGRILVVEVESSLVAALPLDGGPLLSDLWRPTADLVQLLELRSGQIRTRAVSRRAA